ncbi:hypothetical protein PHYC_00288 [Phycisphaerales bacterium]|nr:hypothetical protein PHYC_00288 [Phycisphaerales bacterium]
MFRMTIAAVCVWAMSCAARADDPAVRAGIDLTLRQMEAAAEAGDRDGWLAAVAHGDPEWTKEQTYFANDLKKKPAADLMLSLGELAVTDGAATGDLTFAWTMPEKGERTVAFGARFVLEDGQWRYAGETWEKHEAAGVVVLCDPGLDELAGRVVEAFTNVRSKVDSFFGHDGTGFTSRTQKIKLYRSMKHLQQSICLSYEDSLGGWNEPDESIKLLSNARTGLKALERLLAHEYGHVATFAVGPKANDVMPWWVLEGVAELSAEANSGQRGPEGRVESWARMGNLAEWKELADFETFDKRWYGHVYTQGHHMLKYIDSRWKQEGRNKWLRSMGQGKSIDEASREVFGLSFEELNTDWRATLPAKEEAKPVEPKKEESRSGG